MALIWMYLVWSHDKTLLPRAQANIQLSTKEYLILFVILPLGIIIICAAYFAAYYRLIKRFGLARRLRDHVQASKEQQAKGDQLG